MGALSKKYESAGRGSGVVSRGYFDRKKKDLDEAAGYYKVRVADAGGPSYGLFQLTSMEKGKLGGNVKRFVDRYFPDEFKGLTVNSPPFIRKWRELAQRDPEGFADRQYEFMKKMNYEPLKSRIEKGLDVDVDGLSLPIRNAFFSAAVQHGPGLAYRIIRRAATSVKKQWGTDDLTEVPPADFLKAIYRERGKAWPSEKESRYAPELRDALKLLEEAR
jgi:hypothetical protein